MSRIYCADILSVDLSRKYNISDYRQRKTDRCRLNGDKRRSLAAALLLDKALMDHGFHERDMLYTENEHGKPYFTNAPQLDFSISHSGNCAAVIISDNPCGCDIELISTPKPEIAKRFFHPDEYAAVLNNDSLFYRMWTLKESYIKAIGKGFARPLNSFCVVPTECGFKTESTERGFNFYEYDIIPGYALSVCVKDNVEPTATIIELK